MRKPTTLFLAALCLAPFAQAQNTLAGNLTVQQTVKLTGAASPAQLTSNVNDYAPAGFSTAAVLRLQSDVPRTITGLAGGAAGRMVWLTNVGTQTISLATESVLSTAGNRFAFGASGFDLIPGGSLSIWYDTTSSRWRAATNLAAGGGGSAIDQTARDAAAAAQATADSKQAALANATTLAKVSESAGLPLWDGSAWPGGGSGGTGTVTSVSVVTANGVSGSVANALTTPAITLSLGAITPSSVAAVGSVTGSNLSGTNTGDQTTVTGNAGTATKLATARAINGVSFDGTAAITVPAAAGTLTGTTLASGVTASSLTSAAGGSFGTAAFTAASAYDPAGAAAAITLAGLGGVPTSHTVNGHALTGNVSVTAGDIGLGAVENTALSAWAGSSTLSTLGTISSGTWHGTAIADTYIASAAAWNEQVSFPGFGTTGTTAAVGNDARLSDARTPTAHNQAWSTITSTPTTLSGYGITDSQPLDSDLTAIAALSTTSYGRSLLTPADAAAARTLLGVSSGGVSSVAGRTGDVTLAQADISGLTIASAPQFAKIGVGTAVLADSLFAIQHTPSGAGGKAAFVVTGALTAPASTDLHANAFRDRTVFTGNVTGDSYSSYDTSSELAGSNAYNHTYGFQHRTSYSGSGSLDLIAGLVSQPVHSGTGTITSRCGIYIVDVSGTGSVLGNSGVYVGELTRGVQNWAIHTAGSTPSTFGGYVGIGTIAPQTALDVSGSVTSTVVGASNALAIVAYKTPGDATQSPGVFMRVARGTPTAPEPVLSGDRLGTLVFQSQYNTTPGAFISSAGIFAYATENFGASNYGTKLVYEIAGNGTGRTAKMEIAGSGALRLNSYGAGTLVTDSSGNVTASSDRRLKNVSGKFTRGLEAIMQIQPKVFTWKPESGMNTNDVNVGFIAQDVQPAIPEAVGSMKTVDTEEDDGTGKKVKSTKREASESLTLSDRPIIATLVNAVKELKAENDELEARITKLEAKK